MSFEGIYLAWLVHKVALARLTRCRQVNGMDTLITGEQLPHSRGATGGTGEADGWGVE